MKKNLLTAAVVAVLSAQSVFAAVEVDSKIGSYEKTSGVSGQLSSIGSDTLNNLMTYWSEGFTKIYPIVKTQVEGKGSSTAPPALIEGIAQLGPMSRKMKSKEIDDFVEKYGYKPTEIRVAIDSLAVYVNKDNPVEQLTMEEVDAIFSKSRNKGYPTDITTWGHVGLAGEWADKPMSLYGRNSASGTYGYFKEHTLGKGDYKDTVKEQPGSASVVQGVEKDLGGIGYSGIGYKTSGVKAIALANKSGEPYYEPSIENAISGNYPLARYLYVYVNKKPGEQLDKLTYEFVKYVLSREGQESVIKDGYISLSADVVEAELEKLR
ncbi:phosphate ABC transporter substrate-binding protein PstS family protein [bacterium]|nr:phosphate ABC transporter substrate-binding protein PstS family protein [bacterium]MCP5462184.1 phosphate ABC transporter substrate-binding protein PstS family protein [bacterium]